MRILLDFEGADVGGVPSANTLRLIAVARRLSAADGAVELWALIDAGGVDSAIAIRRSLRGVIEPERIRVVCTPDDPAAVGATAFLQLRVVLRQHVLDQIRPDQIISSGSIPASGQLDDFLLELGRLTDATHNDKAAAGTTGRQRLAFVSPLPPQPSGIADYSRDLLPSLMDEFDIDLIVNQPNVILPGRAARLRRRTYEWFLANGHHYDHVVYQVGNSVVHRGMLALMRRFPGVLVLHDFFLPDLVYTESQLTADERAHMARHLVTNHGYDGLNAIGADDWLARMLELPCSLEYIREALATVVHSRHALELGKQWYGLPGDWARVVPLVRDVDVATDRVAARTALGIGLDEFVVCTFGLVSRAKATDRVVSAWLESELGNSPECALYIVGDCPNEELDVADAARAASDHRVILTGRTDDVTYRNYLAAADVAVQLRARSRGETSAAVLDCLNSGVPTIVNDVGSIIDLPVDTLVRVPAEFTDADIATALADLWRDSARRARLSAAGREFVVSHHAPEAVAARYREVILDSASRANGTLRHLIDDIAAVDGLAAAADLSSVARAMSETHVDGERVKQLLLDVTAVARVDLRTGIQRVVRGQLLAMFRNPPPGFRIEPVYLTDEGGVWRYRYARQYFAGVLGISTFGMTDTLVEVFAGDVFHCVDFTGDYVVEAASAGVYGWWRALGVDLNFMLFDLLPIRRPEFFSGPSEAGHWRWARTVTAIADRVVCISNAVADDYREWLDEVGVAPADRPEIAHVHLGADLDESHPTSGLPADVDDILVRIRRSTAAFLMVGTVEPRKGHIQTVAAMHRLWDEGVDAMLIVVGKAGWNYRKARTQGPVEVLNNDPERGKRLVWLDSASDEFLDLLYAKCDCLVFASEGEGFGLPLIEAARHGLPILARDLPVVREVAGEHALYFHGLEAADLAAGLSEWIRRSADGTAPPSSPIPWRTWAEYAREVAALVCGSEKGIGTE